MIKDPILYVDHIIKSINRINIIVSNLSKEELCNDFIKYDAVMYNLQTLAESTQKLPEHIKNEYPQIEWRRISAFRNILVHDYLGTLDTDSLWFIITDRLQILEKTMLEIQQKLEL